MLFWTKVQKSAGCWLWTGGVDKDGYGKFQITLPRDGLPRGAPSKQRHVRAHVFSYELEHGPVPKGLLVMHSCDTPGCVRPDHLSAGTQKENRVDCKQKGRTARGESSPHAKLTEAQVLEIRRRRQSNDLPTTVLVAKLAAEFGVKENAIYFIWSGRTWGHLGSTV